MEFLLTIKDNIELATAIIVSIGALIATAITQYKKVKRLLAQKDFDAIAAPFIAEAEDSPSELIKKVLNPPIANLPSVLNSNEGKAALVSQATIEKAKKDKPSILKKLGIHSVTDAIPLVSTLYQSLLKPMLKRK